MDTSNRQKLPSILTSGFKTGRVSRITGKILLDKTAESVDIIILLTDEFLYSSKQNQANYYKPLNSRILGSNCYFRAKNVETTVNRIL